MHLVEESEDEQQILPRGGAPCSKDGGNVSYTHATTSNEKALRRLVAPLFRRCTPGCHAVPSIPDSRKRETKKRTPHPLLVCCSQARWHPAVIAKEARCQAA